MSERCDAAIGGEFGARVRCDRLAAEALVCPWCTKVAMYCQREGHLESAAAGLEGHKLLAHPERMPEAVAAVAVDPMRLEMVRFALGRDTAPHYAKLAAALRALGVEL